MSEAQHAIHSDRQCKTFCCQYFHDGTWWALDITAYDSADAESRVAKLGRLQLLGEQVALIPVTVATPRLMMNAFVYFANLIKLALHRCADWRNR